jgi:hypothetical protein
VFLFEGLKSVAARVSDETGGSKKARILLRACACAEDGRHEFKQKVAKLQVKRRSALFHAFSGVLRSC